MSNILDGITPVNGGRPVAAPTAGVQPNVTLPEGYQTPTNPVYADPNEIVVLDTQLPVAPAAPAPDAPAAPAPAPLVTPAPAALPVVEAPQKPQTLFDPNWTFNDAIAGGDIILGEIDRLLTGQSISAMDLVHSLRTGTLDDEDKAHLTEKLGASAQFVLNGLNSMLDQHYKIEAQATYDVVGGEKAWGVLSAWAASAQIDPAERKAINATLAQGGFAARAVASQLLNAFNTHASAEEKQNMISILNTGTPAAPVAPAAAPAPAAPGLITGDTPVQPGATFEPIRNARELAEISRKAVADGVYDARFEDQLTARLKQSMAAGVYKRISLPTPPPANIMQQLRNRG